VFSDPTQCFISHGNHVIPKAWAVCPHLAANTCQYAVPWGGSQCFQTLHSSSLLCKECCGYQWFEGFWPLVRALRPTWQPIHIVRKRALEVKYASHRLVAFFLPWPSGNRTCFSPVVRSPPLCPLMPELPAAWTALWDHIRSILLYSHLSWPSPTQTLWQGVPRLFESWLFLVFKPPQHLNFKQEALSQDNVLL
jgi:hypothetical protein